jgi:hypothetical protein
MPKHDSNTAPPAPKAAIHANAYPKEGFSLLVDGRYKTHFKTRDEASAAAVALKTRFPVLQIVVRDAATAERTPIEVLVP